VNWIEEGNCFDPFRSLYPEQQEISYIPFRVIREGGAPYGKSRLDFFLVGEEIINLVRKVKYEDRLSFDFDHKMVSLWLGKQQVKNRINIFASTLEHHLAEIVGKVSIYDCINNHLVTRFENLSGCIGNVMRWLQEYYEVECAMYTSINPENCQVRMVTLQGWVLHELQGLPDIEVLLELEFTCNFKNLYEAVANNLKLSLAELQNWQKKLLSLERENLLMKVRRMESNFGIESEQFSDAINLLNRFDDQQLKLRANKFRDFVLKNNEKPTKAFCLLGKENNMVDDLEQIKDGTGEDFHSQQARKDYIQGYYADLYKKKMDRLMSIEEFFGDDLLNVDWVLGKKLTEDEKVGLEHDINYEELKSALKTCNLNSSSGWDGISNLVIKKFFPLLGKLLVKLAKSCFETGTLNNSFKMGQIKLIPKKGIPSKIGDWRPITLLCCGYKLISGVIAARLESKLDKIIGRAQKGFMRKKFMGTCTLNIMDRISGSWRHGEAMGVLCVDFVKAFDSVEHEFISNVLNFFNFGVKFIGMVCTLLNDREAVVIVGDGFTDPFFIKRGTPQGDRISPYLFIVAIEVLLIKLKRLEGRGIDNCRFIKNWAEINGLSGEGNTEGFADDISVLFSMSVEAVKLIKGTLAQFEQVSGLGLNISKTQLMVCGTEEYAVGTKVEDIEIVEQVKILGVIIDRKLENLQVNWEDKIAKMVRLSNFWKLQKLLISGRVLVAKTFLLAQVTFFLETLPLNFETGERINRIMAEFVKGTDRIIAKDRWFKERELGGYGLVDIHVLNTCVKANWINRWSVGIDNADFIGMRGLRDSNKPVDQWGVEDEFKDSDKLKYGIMIEWRSFKQQFYRVGGNIGMACLFENDGLLMGKKNIGVHIFGQERYNSLSMAIKILPIKCFCSNGRLKDKNVIENILQMRVNMAEYFRMRNFIGEIIRVFGKITEDGNCLDTFMRGRKRKGGELRRYIRGKNSPSYVTTNPGNIPSVITLWGVGLEFTNRWLVEANFGLWGINKLSAEFRMFIFNFLQGKLYLNNVLARFDNVLPTCTFCSIKGRVDLNERGIGEGMPEFGYYLNLLPAENSDHLFWECEFSQTLIQRCYRWIKGEDWLYGNEEIEKYEFLIGIDDEKRSIVKADLIWKHFVRFFIYNCRKRRKIPHFPSLKFELEGLFNNPGMYGMLLSLQRVGEIY